MKILHIITDLNQGGAQAVLYRLCAHDTAFEHIVISLMEGGKYTASLRDLGVIVYSVDMPKGRVTILGLVKLFKLIRLLKPNVVQTWMYHSDFLGGLVARVAGVKFVFWNIRHTELLPGISKRSTIFLAKLSARLSRLVPVGIICCAHRAKKIHTDLGYDNSKMTVISNGYDLTTFQPSFAQRLSFRSGVGLPNEQLTLGMVGRFDPQKDHLGLLEALNQVKVLGYTFKVCLIGRDVSVLNDALTSEITRLDLVDEVLLMGERNDIPFIMNGIDINILSSSYGEGFPNVVAEAMACGTPCIVTNVGDSDLIVGDTGWIVKPKSPKDLADAIILAINENNNNSNAWKQRQINSRKRICENFSIQKMIENYHDEWLRSNINKTREKYRC